MQGWLGCLLEEGRPSKGDPSDAAKQFPGGQQVTHGTRHGEGGGAARCFVWAPSWHRLGMAGSVGSDQQRAEAEVGR